MEVRFLSAAPILTGYSFRGTALVWSQGGLVRVQLSRPFMPVSSSGKALVSKTKDRGPIPLAGAIIIEMPYDEKSKLRW